MAPKHDDPKRLPALDGFRALAIIAVILSHGFLLADTSRSARAISYTASYLGAQGVALFFAISGFLITTLLLREREKLDRINLRAFYIRRALRILPAAYVFLTTIAILHASGHLRQPLQRGELTSAALFFNNYWPFRSWYTAHFWSLSMEEHFYLLWPPLLARLGPRRALIASAFGIAGELIWRPWSLAHLYLPVPALQRTDLRADAFLFAGALAIVLHGPHRCRVLELLTSTGFRAAALLALAISGAWSLAGSAPVTGTLAPAALFPALLISVIHRPGSRIYRFLESPPLCWMGRISYGLYLWQQIAFADHASPTVGGAALALLPRLAILVPFASASYLLLERPLIRLSHRKTQPRMNADKRRSNAFICG